MVDTPLPVPRLADENTGRTEERTRRITLDASVRRTAREASDSITRRVLRDNEEAPEWSPSEDLVLDVRPSPAATGEIQTGETASPGYQELIAATRGGTASTTVEVRLEMDSGVPSDEVDLVQTPPWPQPTLDELSGEPASWEPLPLPQLTFTVDDPPRRRTLRGAPPPRITTPLGAPDPLPRRRTGEITGPQLPLRAPEESRTIAELLSEIEAASPTSEELSLSESMVVPLPLPFNEQVLRRPEPRSRRLLVPVLVGSGAAVVALGLAVAALLIANRRPAPLPAVTRVAPAVRTAAATRPSLRPRTVAAPAPRQSVEELLSRAAERERRRDHGAAHALYLAALRLSPESPAAVLGQARTAVELNLPGALDLLSRSADAAQGEALDLLRIRQAMLAGQWRQAEVQLRRLPAAQRRDVNAQLWLAEILAARGQSAAAADMYRALLRDRRLGSGPSFADAALGYSRLLLDLGLNELAVGHARRALQAAAGVPTLEAQARQLIVRFQD